MSHMWHAKCITQSHEKWKCFFFSFILSLKSTDFSFHCLFCIFIFAFVTTIDEFLRQFNCLFLAYYVGLIWATGSRCMSVFWRCKPTNDNGVANVSCRPINSSQLMHFHTIINYFVTMLNNSLILYLDMTRFSCSFSLSFIIFAQLATFARFNWFSFKCNP